MQQITERIKKHIDYSGKTLTRIAEEIGLTCQTVSQYYHGKSFPSLESLIKLCKSLDCTYEDILGPL